MIDIEKFESDSEYFDAIIVDAIENADSLISDDYE